jgi:hypothetical protein
MTPGDDDVRGVPVQKPAKEVQGFIEPTLPESVVRFPGGPLKPGRDLFKRDFSPYGGRR